jgi:hypothetical protein
LQETFWESCYKNEEMTMHDFLFGFQAVARPKRRELEKEHRLSRRAGRMVRASRVRVVAALDDDQSISVVCVQLNFSEIASKVESLVNSADLKVICVITALTDVTVPWVRRARLSHLRQMLAYCNKRGVPCTYFSTGDLAGAVDDLDAWPVDRRKTLLMQLLRDEVPLSSV